MADAKSMKQSYDLEIELFKNVQSEAPTLMSTVMYNNDARGVVLIWFSHVVEHANLAKIGRWGLLINILT